MKSIGKVVWYGFLLAIGSILAFMVWAKLRMRFARRRYDDKLPGRQPGFVAGIFSQLSGFFGGQNRAETNPPIVAGYGNVGVPYYGSDESYVVVPEDTRVPTFLEGATGGVQDEAQPGTAPPANIGGPPPVGSGAWSPEYQPCQPALGIVAAYDSKNSLPN